MTKLPSAATMGQLALVLLLSLSCPAFLRAHQEDEPAKYGVDVSFPIHHEKVSTNYAWLGHNVAPSSTPTPKEFEDMPVQPLGNRQKAYDEFIQGCIDYYGSKGKRCVETEKDRIAMSIRQPQSMQNYTELGFKKIRAPKKVYSLLKTFWDKNKNSGTVEKWGVGNTYTNNWAAPSEMVSVEDQKLRGGGASLKQAIWDAARETIEEWTGQELTPTSLYGIRKYTEGAILNPHVDRLPLVSSCIINVDQDVDEPWLLEVYGHDGKAYNVSMEPGDMVLYESHSVIHGRPYPLKGSFYANIFIHFEPVGHSLRHEAKVYDGKPVDVKYHEAVEQGRGGHEADQEGLPPYILKGTPEAAKWQSSHRGGSNMRSRNSSSQTGSTGAHLAAQVGDLEALKVVLESAGDHLLHAKDSNGWTPLHEGARAGKVEVVEYLVKKGSKVNERTNEGIGGTPLWWAEQRHGKNHPVVHFLRSVGGLSIGPDEL